MDDIKSIQDNEIKNDIVIENSDINNISEDISSPRLSSNSITSPSSIHSQSSRLPSPSIETYNSESSSPIISDSNSNTEITNNNDNNSNSLNNSNNNIENNINIENINIENNNNNNIENNNIDNNNNHVEININDNNNINLSNLNSQELINQPYPPAPSYFYQYNIDENGNIVHSIDEIDADSTSLPPPVRLDKKIATNNTSSSNGFYSVNLNGLNSVSNSESDPNAQSPNNNNIYFSPYSVHHSSPPQNRTFVRTANNNNNHSIARKNRQCCPARKVVPAIIGVIICAVILGIFYGANNR